MRHGSAAQGTESGSQLSSCIREKVQEQGRFDDLHLEDERCSPRAVDEINPRVRGGPDKASHRAHDGVGQEMLIRSRLAGRNDLLLPEALGHACVCSE